MATADRNGSDDGATVDRDVTIALEPEQIRLVADEVKNYLSWSVNDEREIRTREDVAAIRATLDEYEHWLDELKWGEATGDRSVTLPQSLLERVARDLYETAGDRLFHGSRKNAIVEVRDDMTLAVVATAIVDQMEATR